MQTVGNIGYGVSVILSVSPKSGVRLYFQYYSLDCFLYVSFLLMKELIFVEQSRLFSSWRSFFFFVVTFMFNLVGLDVFMLEP